MQPLPVMQSRIARPLTVQPLLARTPSPVGVYVTERTASLPLETEFNETRELKSRTLKEENMPGVIMQDASDDDDFVERDCDDNDDTPNTPEEEFPVVPSVHANVSEKLQADLDHYERIFPETYEEKNSEEFQTLTNSLTESLLNDMIKAHAAPDDADNVNMAIGWALDKYPLEIKAHALGHYMEDVLAGMKESKTGAVAKFLIDHLLDVEDEMDRLEDEGEEEDEHDSDDDVVDDEQARVLANIKKARDFQHTYRAGDAPAAGL